jgi:hypothetical protein
MLLLPKFDLFQPKFIFSVNFFQLVPKMKVQFTIQSRQILRYFFLEIAIFYYSRSSPKHSRILKKIELSSLTCSEIPNWANSSCGRGPVWLGSYITKLKKNNPDLGVQSDHLTNAVFST